MQNGVKYAKNVKVFLIERRKKRLLSKKNRKKHLYLEFLL